MNCGLSGQILLYRITKWSLACITLALFIFLYDLIATSLFLATVLAFPAKCFLIFSFFSVLGLMWQLSFLLVLFLLITESVRSTCLH